MPRSADPGRVPAEVAPTGRPRGPRAAEGVQVRIVVDLDDPALDVWAAIPVSLRSIVDALPPEAEPVVGWIPDIVLDSAGLSVASRPAPAGRRRTLALPPVTAPRTGRDPSAGAMRAGGATWAGGATRAGGATWAGGAAPVGGAAVGFYAAAGRAGDATGSADVFVAAFPGPGGETTFVAGMQLSSTVDLAGVPLFGSMLSDLAVQDLQIAYASTDVPAGAVHLPPPASGPSPAYPAGLQLSFTLLAGDAAERFTLSPSGTPGPGARRTEGPGHAADPATPPIRWFPVQKSFGPLLLGRVGVLTTPGRFGLLLDATIRTEALHLNLEGFSLSFESDNVSAAGARIDLDGLGVAFNSRTVALSGSLVRRDTPEGSSYDGAMLMRLGRFSVTAAGAYATLDGHPSLFVFGLVTGAFGGPPAFFVTGLAAGFGYHRALRLPGPGQAQDFPLVRAAREGNRYLPDGDVAAALDKLASGGWVPPERGSYWLAGGVRATSFQMIESFVLLAVQFGTELVIALLGVGSLQLPRAGVGTPYTYVELVLDAVIRPADGTVAVTALLTPNSFVMDPGCRLAGGFAFWLWSGPAHAGDFVLTLGGYHALYDKPAHYPVVPRLSVGWAVSPTLRLAGSAYFALTPACVMAGGDLDLAFESGPLRAWLRAYANFLMCWRPFSFLISIGVSIGASYTLAIGSIRRTFNAEMSADIELWGPPLVGLARVNWWVISFTIPINGGQRPPRQTPVLGSWALFAESFLPGAGEVCRPRVEEGLTGSVGAAGRQVWLVAAGDLVISTETAVPATVAIVERPQGGELRHDGHAVGVYPMGSLSIASEHRVSLVREDGTLVDTGDWAWTRREQGLPRALWGTVNNGVPERGDPLVPALTGLTGVPPEPALPGALRVAPDVLGSPQLRPGALPLPDGPPIDGSTTAPVRDPRDIVAAGVMAPGVVAARTAVVAALTERGLGRGLHCGDLSELAAQVRRTFPAPPMVGPPGSTGPRPVPPVRPAAAAGNAAGRPPSGGGRVPRPEGQEARQESRLAMAFRRYPTGGAAYVRDGYPGRHERAALAGFDGGRLGAGFDGGRLGAGFDGGRLGAGVSLVWRVRPGALRTVHADGPVPVSVTALDAQGRLVGHLLLTDGATRALPAAAQVVVATGVEEGQPVGFQAGTALFQVAPQALFAVGVLLRPQAPGRAGRGRASRAAGDVTVRELGARNWVQTAAGPARGWLLATLLEPAAAVTVAMSRDDDRPPGDPRVPPADVFVVGPDGRYRLPLHSSYPDPSAVRLTYRPPAGPGAALQIVGHHGWWQSGLAVEPSGPAAADRSARPRPTGTTEVHLG